ncbi:MAG: macro domain-containing protein [Sphaerochaetaceae bacterium]
MIKFKRGNLLNEDVEALVNTVNCVGVMGRGVALQFKERFPANFKAYARACKLEEVKPGKMFVFQTGELINPKIIINFPTKRHWKGKSRIEDIVEGLEDLKNVIIREKIKSIALPPLGCGLGGLDWNDVRPLIEEFAKSFEDIDIIVYEPKLTAERKVIKEKDVVPSMTPGRAILITLMKQYLEGLLDTDITLIEIQKLLYFAQEAGEPLRLKFSKAQYGPYAHNLRHVIQKIDGHYITGYGYDGDAPYKPLLLMPGAVEKAKAVLRKANTSKKHLDKVAQLVEGFESTFGLELLATVHWSSKYLNANNLEQVINEVYKWGKRKEKFSRMQIGIAYNKLVEQEWIN